MMDPTGVHWIQAELVGLIKEKKLSDCIRTKQPQKFCLTGLFKMDLKKKSLSDHFPLYISSLNILFIIINLI